VPLHEIRAAHERAVLRRPPVVVPEVEVHEVDAIREWLARQRALAAQRIHQRLCLADPLIGHVDDLLRLRVHAVDQRLRMTLRADLLHVVLRRQEIRTLLRDRIRQVIRQALRRIVRYLIPVDPAHVARRAGRHPHVMRRELLRRLRQIQQRRLRVEQDAVLRLFVDLDLRMVRTHVALPARPRLARDRHRARMPRVARRAASHRPVLIRTPDRVALLAPARHRRRPFQLRERMRRPLRVPRMILLREIRLLRRQPLLAIHRRPRHRSVPASQKLLVDRLVAAPAIQRRQVR